MTQTLTIGCNEAMAEARKTIAYIARQTITEEGENLTELLSAYDSNTDILSRYFQEAASDISFKNRKYVTQIVDSLTISLPANSAYGSAFDDAIRRDCLSYLCYTIVWKWLILGNIGRDSIQIYKSICESLLTSITSRISLRASNKGSGEDITERLTIGGIIPPNHHRDEETIHIKI